MKSDVETLVEGGQGRSSDEVKSNAGIVALVVLFGVLFLLALFAGWIK